MRFGAHLLLTLLAATAGWAFAEPGAGAPHGAPAHGIASFFFDEISHVMVGAVAAVAGVLAHRAWTRRRWQKAPAAVVVEAVLAVDMADSTLIATKHGDSLAMRARNVLERRIRDAARDVAFFEGTGDGCLMTFPSVDAAASTACKLLDGLRKRPPDMAPAPDVEIRAAIAYGEILMDAKGARHGAVINKAFRLMNLPAAAFVSVDGEPRLDAIPDRNRIFLDEEAAARLAGGSIPIRQVGVCRIKGFGGFHRVYEIEGTEADDA